MGNTVKKNIQKQLHQWNNKKVIALGIRQHKNKLVLCFYCGKVVKHKKNLYIFGIPVIVATHRIKVTHYLCWREKKTKLQETMTKLQKELILVNQYKLGGNTSQLPTAPKENTQTMKLKFDNLYWRVYIHIKKSRTGR